MPLWKRSSNKAEPAPNRRRRRRLILMVWDVENLIGGYTFATARPENIDVASTLKYVNEVLSAKFEDMGTMEIVQKAYANWGVQGMVPLRDQFKALGIDTISVTESIPDCADQVISLALSDSSLDDEVVATVLFSGDGGFERSIDEIKKKDKIFLVGCAIKGHASHDLQEVCDRFVEVEISNHPESGETKSVPSDRATTSLKRVISVDPTSTVQVQFPNQQGNPTLSTTPTYGASGASMPSLHPAVTGSDSESYGEQDVSAAPTGSFEDGEVIEDVQELLDEGSAKPPFQQPKPVHDSNHVDSQATALVPATVARTTTAFQTPVPVHHSSHVDSQATPSVPAPVAPTTTAFQPPKPVHDSKDVNSQATALVPGTVATTGASSTAGMSDMERGNPDRRQAIVDKWTRTGTSGNP